MNRDAFDLRETIKCHVANWFVNLTKGTGQANLREEIDPPSEQMFGNSTAAGAFDGKIYFVPLPALYLSTHILDCRSTYVDALVK